MDTKAYIESGVIESYVLGLASPDEAAELEMLCTQYPSVQEAVDNFATLMEDQFLHNAVPPPPEVRSRLMQQLSGEFRDATEQSETPVISIAEAFEPPAVYQCNTWKYIAAAAVILLIGSAALNLYLYNNYNQTASKYEALLTERNSLQASNDVFKARLGGMESSLRIMQSPDVQKIMLAGVAGKEAYQAAVYWDKKTNDVYLLPTGMAALPENTQYQLWAIVDGAPVDAGLIDACDGLCKMKNIPAAQAFAITIEKKGGSVSPTLSAMVVMGKV